MSDERARARHRLNVFDREAKAAARLLEQVRQYVGRSGNCQAADFEDLCTIHHAINTLLDRVKSFSSAASIPKVYGHNGVKAYGVRTVFDYDDMADYAGGLSVIDTSHPDDERQLSVALPGSNVLEKPEAPTNNETNAPAPLFDLVREVPDISMEDLCRDVELSQIIGGAPLKTSRPSSSVKGPKRKKLLGSPQRATPPQTSRPTSVSSRPRTVSEPTAASELLVEVTLEFPDEKAAEGQHLQEMRLEMQVVELPSRTPMRSLRVMNKAGSCGTLVLEVNSLRRAELCMALVKEFTSSVPGLDENGELSMLSPGGNNDRGAEDVSSALRVPVSQLLSACANGASLEWEVDGTRTIVINGKMSKGGKAVEYFPSNLKMVPETPTSQQGQSSPRETPAGRGAAAVEALKKEVKPPQGGGAGYNAEEHAPTTDVAPAPPTNTIPDSEQLQLDSGGTIIGGRRKSGAALEVKKSSYAANIYSQLDLFVAEKKGEDAHVASMPAPQPPAPQPPADPPQRKPRPAPQPQQKQSKEDFAEAVSKYVGRLLMRM
eukprot:TRINITY_DN3010_c0_g1_i1.p1 TRINITY_DN3010_c0_g1~~TRINITY_DN3010_c0_g1_i1.p1  ORF type:complete len:563 (-),score=115.91 TRINITY_DN3010_c0_g1_i1:263-1900(-)